MTGINYIKFCGLNVIMFVQIVRCEKTSIPKMWLMERNLKNQRVTLHQIGTSHVNHFCYQTLYQAEWCHGNALDLYSGDIHFESWPCYQLFWLKFGIVLFRLSM